MYSVQCTVYSVQYTVYCVGHYSSLPAGGIKLTRSIAMPPTRTAATSKCFDFPGLRLMRPSLLKVECPATHTTQHTRHNTQHTRQNTHKTNEWCKCKMSIIENTLIQRLLPTTLLRFTSLFCAVIVYQSSKVVTNLKKNECRIPNQTKA